MEHQLVIFELAQEFYGVDIASVESIIKMQPVTVVPHTQEYVEGVINLRGNVLPVINLHERLHLPTQPTSKNSRIIVVLAKESKFGMIVDMVCEVLHIPDDLIEPPPTMLNGDHTNVIVGIAKLPERLVMLLDMEQVLADL